jgi:hypothetical protein
VEVRKWLRQQSKDFHAAGFDALVKRWNKCINVGGGHVKKQKFFFQFRISFYILYPFVTYLLTLRFNVTWGRGDWDGIPTHFCRFLIFINKCTAEILNMKLLQDKYKNSALILSRSSEFLHIQSKIFFSQNINII